MELTKPGCFFVSAVLVTVVIAGCDDCHAPAESPTDQPVTFNKDIAPIMYDHCAACHRPGEPAPFSLLTYEDVRKRADQIVRVTGDRYMPPWLPEPEYGQFEGERRLTETQVTLLARWAEQGGIEGELSDLPPVPVFAEGWQLGEPDLVVKMDRPYLLPARGADVFRNFVMTVPVKTTRYVAAVELRPGNKRIVHHANMLIDTTPSSRQLDAMDSEEGFAGMEIASLGQMTRPAGHLIEWKAGNVPRRYPPGRAWRLEKGTDLIVNMHMLPSGKPETIDAQAGFYFTDEPPKQPPMLLMLLERDGYLDIPAGAANHVVADSITLPVDIDVLAVYPHVHLLGKEIKVWGELPDGGTTWLIWIKRWNFDWQAVYRYAEPVPLPKGTTIRMRYTYDNSSANERNPHNPPRRVRSGNLTNDEMSHLWLQVLPRTVSDRLALEEAQYRHDLVKYPRNVKSLYNLGVVLQARGLAVDAGRAYLRAVQLQPGYAFAHYNLGVLEASRGHLKNAVVHLRHAAQLRPDWPKPLNNLAWLMATTPIENLQAPDEAVELARRAIELTKHDDASTLDTLAAAYAATGRFDKAVQTAQRALELAARMPDKFLARDILARIDLYKDGKPYRESIAGTGDPITTTTNR